jgi:hypothetical protein
MFDMPEEGPEENRPRRSERQGTDRLVDHMMYLLVGPFIGWPGWEDLMTRHKDDIVLKRLAHGAEILKEEMCTEFEAMLYLSTASLAHPISHDWYTVYMYLFRRWNPENADTIGVKVEELERNQMEDLIRLRRWIFRTQMDHLKGRRRTDERKEAPSTGSGVERAQPEVIQPRMFDFESSEDDEEGE